MEYVSFPGLGIGPFHIDKVAFTVFGRDIAWYGILITFGMLLAVLFALRASKFEKIKTDDIYDLAISIIIFGVIGARAYYVIFSWTEFSYVATGGTFFQNLWGTIYNCIAIWDGGLAIYGGIIAGLIVAFIFAKIKKIPAMKVCDILVPCVLVGQIIGRWGNFINVEAYGYETTLPWRMGIHYSLFGNGIETGVWDLEKFVHPTFLYESLWNLIILVAILIIYKKKKYDGQHFCTYLIWYGFGRMLIENLRTDSLMLGSLRISVLVGCVSFVSGIILLICLIRKNKAERLKVSATNTVADGTVSDDKPDDNVTDENTVGGNDTDSSPQDSGTTEEK